MNKYRNKAGEPREVLPGNFDSYSNNYNNDSFRRPVVLAGFNSNKNANSYAGSTKNRNAPRLNNDSVNNADVPDSTDNSTANLQPPTPQLNTHKKF